MSYLTGSRRLVRGHHKERSMTSITDRIEIQLDAGSDEVTLTRAEAVEVATQLRRQAAEPGRCLCGADAYCSDYMSNGYHRTTAVCSES